MEPLGGTRAKAVGSALGSPQQPTPGKKEGSISAAEGEISVESWPAAKPAQLEGVWATALLIRYILPLTLQSTSGICA